MQFWAMKETKFGEAYRGKTVLITGHTGFKGSWLSIWLNKLGANIIGFSLEDYDNDILYNQANIKDYLFADIRGDIRDLDSVKVIFDKYKPDMVFHLAAQTLVRESYDFPVKSFSTNILGTVNVLECIKNSNTVSCGVFVTSDKCYKDKNQNIAYKESDELGGHDPYSASKACAELIISSYKNSFFNHSNKLIASVRAGNVIGGGDWSKDQLVPDCIRHLKKNKVINIRNPQAVRPWQHVLEPLYGYLLIGQGLLNKEQKFAESWNFGPNPQSQIKVHQIVELIIKYWGGGKWISLSKPTDINKKHETQILTLDSTKAMNLVGWQPIWNIEKTVEMTLKGYKNLTNNQLYNTYSKQIDLYITQQKALRNHLSSC